MVPINLFASFSVKGYITFHSLESGSFQPGFRHKQIGMVVHNMIVRTNLRCYGSLSRILSWGLILYCLGTTAGYAQKYKYIGIKDGLSSRYVVGIRQDRKGYMWFLTHQGIDCYDGKSVKTYRLTDDGKVLSLSAESNRIHLDRNGTLWEAGGKGNVFRYDNYQDCFLQVLRLSSHPDVAVTCSYIDSRNTLWLCRRDSIFLYHIDSGETDRTANPVQEEITNVVQTGPYRYFIGTENGLYHALLAGKRLSLPADQPFAGLHPEVNSIYYNKGMHRLFVGTFRNGLYVYDLQKRTLTDISMLGQENVTSLSPFDEKSLLVGLEGLGVYRMETDTYRLTPFIPAGEKEDRGLNGSTVTDLYVDGNRNVWIADYPNGITQYDMRYRYYRWIGQGGEGPSASDKEPVYAVLEDSEGDFWFATDEGIRLLSGETKRWHTFHPATTRFPDKRESFYTLCEVAPGVVWAAGNGADVWQMNKRQLTVHPVALRDAEGNGIAPDRYIRHLTKDSQGFVWIGGHHNLVCYDTRLHTARLYKGLHSITCLQEKDPQSLWVGTATGICLVDKRTGKTERMKLPAGSCYINSLNKDAEDRLYAGTNGNGLLVYDPRHHTIQHYDTRNSQLASDNIHTVLLSHTGNVVMSTEEGISSFIPSRRLFYNWSKEQELDFGFFNPQAGTVNREGNLIFGTSNGALEFNGRLRASEQKPASMVFRDFKISYREVTRADRNSPLTADLDSLKELRLAHSQNTFSFRVSPINYDSPYNTLYSWKVEGLYDAWSKPTHDDILNFTNLHTGDYVLRVRCISGENQEHVLEERVLHIAVLPPLWLSAWAVTGYLLLSGLLGYGAARIWILRRQRLFSEEKIRFFMQTAHELHTPITLIKAPLEDLNADETLSPEAKSRLQTALNNTNSLFRLTTGLMNLERIHLYSPFLTVAECDLARFMDEVLHPFRAYAAVRNIVLVYNPPAADTTVWLDREKMESILKNLLSNAIHYTASGGQVTVTVRTSGKRWSVEICDTGIGIPAYEQSKVFRHFFRAANAVHTKLAGSGIGLVLVKKLVEIHRGKISWKSREGTGTCIRADFMKAGYPPQVQQTTGAPPEKMSDKPDPALKEPAGKEGLRHARRYRLLLAEDNDELRHYLEQALSGQYVLLSCCNGKEALTHVKDFRPDLVLSDVMMPEMDGYELCNAIRQDIETSHIPLILLTALCDEKSILQGFQVGADEYITKPFNPHILKAVIANTLAARETLRKKYSEVREPETAGNDTSATGAYSTLDWGFLNAVNGDIRKNLQNTDYNVETLGTALNMSRTSFYNKIKALTGQSPSEYIRLMRLKHAAHMLRENRYSIAEVADSTGFCDTKYFREVFKKYYKVSPSRYARMQEDESCDG